MSIRSFVFCDACNVGATRYVEQRRDLRRGDAHGRRITDGRAWIEADPEIAVRDHGWALDERGGHVCPACQQRLASDPPGGA